MDGINEIYTKALTFIRIVDIIKKEMKDIEIRRSYIEDYFAFFTLVCLALFSFCEERKY